MNAKLIAKNASTLLKKTGDILQQNSPVIFAGIAIAGVVTTTVMAVRATMKAEGIIEEASYTDPDDSDVTVQPSVRETIALTWKCYIPVVISGGLTIGSIVAAHQISARRNAILAGLLTTSQQALEEYQKKAEEVIGKGKSEKIKEELAGDKLLSHPIDEGSVVMTGFGNHLCFDTWSGRYFRSDYEKIRQIVNDFNFQLNNDFSMCMNEFYEMMNLDTAGCGEEVGFTTQRPLELDCKSKLSSRGEPCLVIDYKYQPSPSFRNW